MLRNATRCGPVASRDAPRPRGWAASFPRLSVAFALIPLRSQMSCKFPAPLTKSSLADVQASALLADPLNNHVHVQHEDTGRVIAWSAASMMRPLLRVRPW